MSHGECWIGINLSVPTTFLPHPSSPYPSRIFPSAWLKRKKKRAHDEIAESKEKKTAREKEKRIGRLKKARTPSETIREREDSQVEAKKEIKVRKCIKKMKTMI
jgi:hypothetical protein